MATRDNSVVVAWVVVNSSKSMSRWKSRGGNSDFGFRPTEIRPF